MKPVASGRFRYQRINVEAALRHPRSLLHRVRNMVLARTEYTEPGSIPFTLITVKPAAVLGLCYRSESREVLMLANCSQQAVEVQLPPLAEGYWSPIRKISSTRTGYTAGKRRGWRSPAMVTAGSAAACFSAVFWSAEERPQGHRRHRHTDAGSHFTRKIGADGHRFTPRAIVKGAVSGMIAAHWREQVVLMFCRLRLAGKLSLPRFFHHQPIEQTREEDRRGSTGWCFSPPTARSPAAGSRCRWPQRRPPADRPAVPAAWPAPFCCAPSQTEQYSSPAAGPWSTGCGFSHALARCARHR